MRDHVIIRFLKALYTANKVCYNEPSLCKTNAHAVMTVRIHAAPFFP